MGVKPEATDARVLADRIVLSMTELAGALGRLNDAIAQGVGVAPTDLLCLHTLNREGATTAGQLSARLGRTTGAVTHMIDRLEKAGYVRRQPDPDDRRRVLVEALPDQFDRISDYYAGMDTRLRALMGELDAEQLATIRAFLDAAYRVTADESDQLAR